MMNDVDRPNIDGNKPKMIGLVSTFNNPHEEIIPFWEVTVTEVLGSNLRICGSLDSKEKWNYGYVENSRHFSFSIFPSKLKRYYQEGEQITIECLMNNCRPKNVKKFRKYSGTPEACAKRMAEWLNLCIENQPSK